LPIDPPRTEAIVNPAVKRTRVKICGITRAEDAEAAVTAGADAIGLVFWQPSPRSVSIAQAAEICRQLPAFVSVVALTVNATSDCLTEIVSELPVDLLQFHGDETPERCQQFDCSYIKALRMKPELSLAEEFTRYSSARSLLLDTYRKGVPGGTGESFDWERIPEQFRSRTILAGGLNPGNVFQAITAVRPFAVDVSGGVEQAAGIKDPAKISEFIAQVDQANRAV
jgi:phosphoribosylanthranilate isomerase